MKITVRIKIHPGTSQWLELHFPNARGAGWIPGRGARIPHASQPKYQNIINRRNIITNSIKTFKKIRMPPTRMVSWNYCFDRVPRFPLSLLYTVSWQCIFLLLPYSTYNSLSPLFQCYFVMNMSFCFLLSCHSRKTSHKGKYMVKGDC